MPETDTKLIPWNVVGLDAKEGGEVFEVLGRDMAKKLATYLSTLTLRSYYIYPKGCFGEEDLFTEVSSETS